MGVDLPDMYGFPSAGFLSTRPGVRIPRVPFNALYNSDTVPDEFEGQAREEIVISKAERAKMKVCVLGSGAFGTAMGTVIARNGFPVTLLTRRDLVAESINKSHIHPMVENYKLPEIFTATTSAAEALRDADFIVHAIPVQATFDFLEPLKDLIPPDVPIVSTSKGLKTDTLEMMSELIPRALGRPQALAFLSGPTFAKELMEGYPSGAVLASENGMVAQRCRTLFNCAALRCYTTSDVIGVEMGGALKNVYALAAGAAEGMGFSANTVSFIVTRACAEMNMMAVSQGAKSHTMAGLAGIGDLMLTCMGGLSRNKAVGMRLGRGEALESVLEARGTTKAGVAEGVATTPAAAKLAKQLGVEAPFINVVASVLEGKREIPQALKLLMTGREFTRDFSAMAHVMEKRGEAYLRLDRQKKYEEAVANMTINQ